MINLTSTNSTLVHQQQLTGQPCLDSEQLALPPTIAVEPVSFVLIWLLTLLPLIALCVVVAIKQLQKSGCISQATADVLVEELREASSTAYPRLARSAH